MVDDPDTVVPQEDTVDPQNDTVDPQNDTVDPQNDTVDPQNDTVDPQNDTVDPQNDTVDPQNDTVDPQNDTVDPQNDTVDPQNDTVDPQNDTVDRGGNPPAVRGAAYPHIGSPIGGWGPFVPVQAARARPRPQWTPQDSAAADILRRCARARSSMTSDASGCSRDAVRTSSAR